MSKCLIFIFPYGGYQPQSTIESKFWELIEKSREVANTYPPVVVLSVDTKNKGLAEAFLEDARRTTFGIDLLETSAVDTCQMWVDGWNYVLREYPGAKRVVQLPGDIVSITDPTDFYTRLATFVTASEPWDIVIGDFSIRDHFGGKYLIDEYGTYPLLANWFPQQARAILSKNIVRPRSEFLNIDVGALKKLLLYRKFAYEQTLNMLIRAWDVDTSEWEFQVHPTSLGEMNDDSSYRQYGGCLDQIERMERLLKQLWRSIYEPTPEDSESKYEKFVDKYHLLDHRSSSIREGAMITIRSLLGAP